MPTKKPTKKRAETPRKLKSASASDKVMLRKKTEPECLALLVSWKAAVEKAHGKQLSVRKQKLTMQLKIAPTKGGLLGSLGAHWKKRYPGTAPFQFDYLLLLSVFDAAGDVALVDQWLSRLKEPLEALTKA